MTIIDEPVRGRIPPPWFTALPGLERMRALANGLVALPPFYRLTGLVPGHVSPGNCTYTRPSSPWLAGGAVQLIDMASLPEIALRTAATTAVGPGQYVELLSISYSYMRPARPEPGNCLARASVRSASRFFICVNGDVVDPSGRELVVVTAQYRICEMESAPPAPPTRLEPVQEPTYDLPDPVHRPLPAGIRAQRGWDDPSLFDMFNRIVAGELLEPPGELFGLTQQWLEDGTVETTIPASEWFCAWEPTVSDAIITFAVTGSLLNAGYVNIGPDETHAEPQQTVYIHSQAPADGRPIHASGKILTSNDRGATAHAQIRTADGTLIAEATSVSVKVPKTQRIQRHLEDTVRTLATLVFSDIVGSTEHLARLGDADWAKVKEQHHEAMRQQIAMHKGIEVDTAGDGFFVRFDSPAQALEYARATQAAASSLGLQLRTGMHTGECEIQGREVTGMAVHVAARLESKAEPGEIIVSEVVKTLVMGSSHAFDDRGERELKGVPGTWRIFALTE